MLKIRRSRDRLIFNMGIPIPGKDGLILRRGPGSLCDLVISTHDIGHACVWWAGPWLHSQQTSATCHGLVPMNDIKLIDVSSQQLNMLFNVVLRFEGFFYIKFPHCKDLSWFWWLGGRLQYLLWQCLGDTAVWHKAVALGLQRWQFVFHFHDRISHFGVDRKICCNSCVNN